MALSGTIKGKVTQNSSVYAYYMAWSGTQSIDGNYTDVTVKHYWTRSSTSLNFDTTVERRYGITIDGTTSSGTKHFDFSPWPSDTTISTYTKRVYHNSDGTKSIKISTYANGRAASYGPSNSAETSGDCTASATITLDTIPRASSVTCNSFNIGSSTTINIGSASSNFRHTIKYTYGDLSGVIADKTALTSIGWTPDKAQFYSRIPNGRTGYGSVTCETYSGSTLVGTKTANFQAYAVESDCMPDVSVTVTDTNKDVSDKLTGNSSIIVKYLSKPQVTITATPKYSSSIKSRKIQWADGSYSTNNPATFNNGVTSSSVTVSATDSRNYTKSVPYNLASSSKWIEYVKLAFTRIKLSRQESTLSTANIKVSGNYFNGSFGKVTNDFTLKYRYKPNESGSTFTDYKELTSNDIPRTNDTFDYSETLQNIDYQKEYIFEFVLEDEAMIVYSGEQKLESGQAILRTGKDYIRTSGKIIDRFGTSIHSGLSIYAPGGVSVDANTTIEELILTEKNVPDTGFWYVKTMFYADKSPTAARTQIAYPYASAYQSQRKGIYVRSYVVSTGWSSWRAIGITDSSLETGKSEVGELSVEWGKITITPVANTPTSQVIYFDKTYTHAPLVLVSASTGVIGTGVLGVSVVGVGANYATLSVTRINTVPTGVHFLVIGKVA